PLRHKNVEPKPGLGDSNCSQADIPRRSPLMESAHWSPVLRYIRRIAAPKHVDEISDGDLVERFITVHDEDAFAALVYRHSAMVMGVCRRVLNDNHTAEDVFQATFLVLVRKARRIAKPDCLGAWL